MPVRAAWTRPRPRTPLRPRRAPPTELDRAQLEQLQDQVAALLAAMPPPPLTPVGASKPERSPFLAGLPAGPRGGGSIEWKWIGRGQRRFGPYPHLRVRVSGRHRSIYLKALAQATRAAARRDGQAKPSA
jgi:hypothetical protein